MMRTDTSILTYHSQNVRGHGPSENDHVALQMDLEALNTVGIRVIPLALLIDYIEGKTTGRDLAGTVCITFDDGCDFDVIDLEYPGFGLQRSFLGIMQDFIDSHGQAAQPQMHASTFVIASREARRIIDDRSLFGKGWISDDWWASAESHHLLSVVNHGWDHNHPDIDPLDSSRGGFTQIETHAQCRHQVVEAAAAIEQKTGVWPDLFAYPFGESSAYIRETFFPGNLEEHGCRAALGTEPGKVTRNSDRWNLPRFVCGRDWKSPGQLLELLR